VITLVALLSVATFMGGLWLLRIGTAAAGVLSTAKGALAVLRDAGVDDATREKTARQASAQMARGLASILIRGAVALLASLVPMHIASSLGVASVADVGNYLARWDVIVVTTVVIVAGWYGWGRLWASK